MDELEELLALKLEEADGDTRRETIEIISPQNQVVVTCPKGENMDTRKEPTPTPQVRQEMSSLNIDQAEDGTQQDVIHTAPPIQLGVTCPNLKEELTPTQNRQEITSLKMGEAEESAARDVPVIHLNVTNSYIEGLGTENKLAPTQETQEISSLKTNEAETSKMQDVTNSVPLIQLDVTYPNGERVEMGKELTPIQVKDAPMVKWDGKSDRYYTLAMVDPDAPSREKPTLREVKHWLVGNISGNDLDSGEVIASYLGSGPPKGTGLHRFVFLLFEQEDRVEFDEPKSGEKSRAHRPRFSLKSFAEKYKLGEPIAGNYFVAEWDEYVEVRNKTITK